VSRGLCGGVFLKSRASCLSLSVFIGFSCDLISLLFDETRLQKQTRFVSL
jgi:hypothetical protein